MLLGAIVVVGAALAVASPAGAVSNPGVTPNPVPYTIGQVNPPEIDISWSGAVPGQVIYLDICKKSISDPTFKVSQDCSMLGGNAINGTASGAGTHTHPFFYGADPAEEPWGCFAADDTDVPAGVEKFTTCYVRITDTSISNNDADVEVPFTFTLGEEPVIPEAPVAILLPAAGVLAALGGVVLVRRRQGAAV